MVVDARGRVNGETFPDNPLDDRVSLFEHKTLASLMVTVEARANLVRSDLKSVQRILMLPVILALLLPKNSRHIANTLSWSRVPLPISLATSTSK